MTHTSSEMNFSAWFGGRRGANLRQLHYYRRPKANKTLVTGITCVKHRTSSKSWLSSDKSPSVQSSQFSSLSQLSSSSHSSRPSSFKKFVLSSFSSEWLFLNIASNLSLKGARWFCDVPTSGVIACLWFGWLLPGAFSVEHNESKQTVSVGLGLVQSCFGSSESRLILDNAFKLFLFPDGHDSAILSYLQSRKKRVIQNHRIGFCYYTWGDKVIS